MSTVRAETLAQQGIEPVDTPVYQGLQLSKLSTVG